MSTTAHPTDTTPAARPMSRLEAYRAELARTADARRAAYEAKLEAAAQARRAEAARRRAERPSELEVVHVLFDRHGILVATPRDVEHVVCGEARSVRTIYRRGADGRVEQIYHRDA